MIDFATKLKDLSGKEIQDGDSTATLGRACAGALLAVFADERDLGGEDKVRRFKLAMRVTDAKKINDLTVEEIAELKKVVAKAYSPLIVGRCWALLDPKA